MPATSLEALLDGPALAPPPGVHPNLVSGPSFQVQGLALTITTCIIITLAVAMRIFIRLKTLRQLSLEDYLVLLAWLSYVAGYNTIAVMLAKHGVGRHQWDMTVRELIEYLYLFHAGVILYSVVILPLKLSIILQVLRAFVPSGLRNFTFWMSHTLIWVNILFYIISTALVIFACRPTAKSYDPTIKGRCLDSTAVNIAAAALNSLSDLLLIILPQQVIWKLSLPTKRKWALSIAFLGGVLSFASALVRLAYLTSIERTLDKTYYTGLVGLWSFPEIAFGFLVACLPSVRGFILFLRNTPDTPRMKTFKTRIQTMFGGADAEGNLPNAKEQPRTSQYHARYHYPRPQQISDIEYHELVVKSGGSQVTKVQHVIEESKSAILAKAASTDSTNSNQIESR